MTDKQIKEVFKNGFYCIEPCPEIKELQAELKAKEQECEELRGVIRKDICSHYVLGECSKKHHNNCVGRNQCIKDLEQECEKLKVWKSITPLKTKMLVKALTEIKEIANYSFNLSTSELMAKLEQILQKCEVLDE